MLFLLLRLLTAPTSVFPAAATVDAVARPQPTFDRAVALSDARAQQMVIDAGPGKIRALMRGASDTQYRASCVAHRLDEAQVHVALARDEMQRLAQPDVSAGDGQHALRRLTLIAERTQEVERAARACVDDDTSSISAIKYDTAVPPAVERKGDVTRPPLPPHGCAGSTCLIIDEP
jgi:hypothetical protein